MYHTLNDALPRYFVQVFHFNFGFGFDFEADFYFYFDVDIDIGVKPFMLLFLSSLIQISKKAIIGYIVIRE